MTVLSPLALWLGALIAVPLAVHLLRRRIGARVDFPATRYLARAEREHSRRLRLRNLLLMALRVGAVLAVAGAAAHPIADVPLSGGRVTAHAPTAIAIVLDNSLSTSLVVNGSSVLDRLRDAARLALGDAGAEDRAWLLTTDGDVVGGTPATIADALTRVTAFAGVARLDRVVARASMLLNSAAIPERALLVLTDGQASSWTHAMDAGATRTVVLAPVIAPVRNRSVVAASAEPPRWTPRGSVSARIAGPDSVSYRLALAGRTLARGTAEADATILVSAAPSERGWLAGTVEIEPDELRADDVRHFGVWIGAAPGIALDPAAGPFMASAIAVLAESQRVTTAASAGAANSIAIVPAEALRTLPALIVAPSSAVQVGAANRALERAGVPWRFGPRVSGATTVKGSGMTGVEVSSRYALERLPGAATDTLATAGSDPWIVSGERFVLIASPLDPASSSLPVRAAFVPWLGEVLSQRLGASPGRISNTTPGERVVVPAGATQLASTDGGRIELRDLNVEAPRRAGSYRWLRGDSTVGILVVNADSAESRLDRLSSAELGTRVHGRRTTMLSETDALARAVFAASSRRDLVAPLLALAALLLVAEAFVAREGRRLKVESPAGARVARESRG